MTTAASKLMQDMQSKMPKKILAKTAARKRVEPSNELPKGVSTRAAAKLVSTDPTVKGFTLANLRKAKTKHEVLFQCQGAVENFVAQFEKCGFNMEQQAAVVGFMLKEFQRADIYASVDSLIYHRIGNTVSIKVKFILQNLNVSLGDG